MLTFNFSVEETNLLLEGLRELQFKRVIELMRKIETDAKEQLRPKDNTPVVEE